MITLTLSFCYISVMISLKFIYAPEAATWEVVHRLRWLDNKGCYRLE